MRTAVATLRWIFWIEAAVLLGGAFALMLGDLNFFDQGQSDLRRWIVIGETLCGAAALVAALAMHLRLRWAVAAGLAASALNVLFVPVLTVFGIYGLVILCRKTGRDQLGRKPPPLPGAKPSKPLHVSNIVLAALVIVAIQPMLRYLQVQGVPNIPLPWLIAGLFLEIWIVVLIHELSHALAGWLCGFEVVHLVVGRTALIHQDERWRLKRVKKMGAGGWTGIRPRSNRLLREKFVLFSAAGPMGSLFFGILLFAVFLASPGHAWARLAPVIGITALISIQTFVGNSLPVGPAKLFGDGARVLQLTRMNPEGERLLARLRTLLIFSTPLRPCDLPTEWIASGLSVPDGTKDHLAGCMRVYECCLDRGDVETAARWLDEWTRIQKASPAGIGRDAGLTEVAYFEARYRNNSGAARQRLDQASAKLSVERYTIHRAWAAVMLAEGRLDEARELVEQALADLDRRAITGHRLFERDLLADLKRCARAPAHSQPLIAVPVA